MPGRPLLRLLAAVLIGSLARAQSPSVVLRVGDSVPGAGRITDIEAVEVDSFGYWSALVRTDDPVAHTVLYLYGTPYVRSGDSVPGSGASIVGLQPATWDLFGIPTYVAGVSTAPLAQVLMFGTGPELLGGQSAQAGCCGS